MQVTDINLVRTGSESELSGTVTGVPKGFDRFRLWFRFPADMMDGIRRVGNPFLVSLLPVVAKTGSDLQVEGEVSPVLLENLGQVRNIWNDWYGLKFGAVAGVTTESTGEAASPGVGCFFSGGVDSFYTVLKNLAREKGENRITHLLYVRGFDVDLDDHDLDSLVTGRLNRIGEEIGLPLIRASTNLRRLADRFASWGKLQHGAALAGTAHCLSGIIGPMLIPATHTYQRVWPWGTHPLLDPLWSDEFVSFITDGCEMTRSGKIRSRIAGSSVALDHLRVCHSNTGSKYNCGRCEKCIRTKVLLKLAGVLERCATLDGAVDLEQVRSIRIRLRITEDFVIETLAELRERDIEHELQQALQKVLSRWNPARIKIHLRDWFRL